MHATIHAMAHVFTGKKTLLTALLAMVAMAQAQNCTAGEADLTPCDDGNLTSVGDRCVGGVCTGCEPSGTFCDGE